MASLYVPFQGKKPAALEINGHRVVLMSRDPVPLEDEMELFGADRIKRFDVGLNSGAESKLMVKIAASANGGVVVLPSELPIEQLIRNLEEDLPWIQ